MVDDAPLRESHTEPDAPSADGTPLAGEPTNADELAPGEAVPNPPEGGNQQPRDPDAIEDEPGQDL